MKPGGKGEANNNDPSREREREREREIHPKNNIKIDCVFGTPNPPQPCYQTPIL
jgi:hypothetical protein